MTTNSSSERLYDLERQTAELFILTNKFIGISDRALSSINSTLLDDDAAGAYSFDAGDTAWLLCSTAIILMMTIPGLAIYYGGMVRASNVLATAMQSLSITCLISFLWLCLGYSLSLAPVDASPPHSFIGDRSRFWLLGMDLNSYHDNAATVPEAVYCTFQLTFAILTAALICGSFADRMKYGSMLLFMGFWHILVYCPIAHANWHSSGFLRKRGSLDFAGGNVVHISSGIAGLMSTIVIGNRKGFGIERFEPHNILLTFMGASLLWVGWFGFNGGSAGAANPRAAMAILNTQIGACTCALSWMVTEWYINQHPSVLGMLSGIIAGLVTMTPACGYIDTTGAFIIGFFAGPFCYAGAQLKHRLGFDDALDAFGVHAIGGIFGSLMTGFFARAEYGGVNGVFFGNGEQLLFQIYGVLFSIGWSGVGTYLILQALDKTIGLRVSLKEEMDGLDAAIHGESVISSSHGFDGSTHGAKFSSHGGGGKMSSSYHGNTKITVVVPKAVEEMPPVEENSTTNQLY